MREEEILESADDRIQKHRMGDVTITVTDSAGKIISVRISPWLSLRGFLPSSANKSSMGSSLEPPGPVSVILAFITSSTGAISPQ